MSDPEAAIGRQAFADFMYAVVAGIAFADINLGDSLSVLFPTFFLLIVVLEDFYLYQTQVKAHPRVFPLTSFRSLFFDVTILLSWYLCFISRKSNTDLPVYFYIAFFSLKWITGLVSHSKASAEEKSWLLSRYHFFLISISGGLIIIATGLGKHFVCSRIRLSWGWLILAVIWTVQVSLWWTRKKLC